MVPWIAVLLVGGWIGGQRYSIHVMERESALLLKHIATLRSAMPASDILSRLAAAPGNDATREAMDWRKIADEINESQQSGIAHLRSMMRFEQRLQAMTLEDLTAALDEMAALDLPRESRAALDNRLLESLAAKDPEIALKRFIGRLDEDPAGLGWQLAEAFKAWAVKDPQKAADWFEQQIAAGIFDAKALGGRNENRIHFEGAMIGALLVSDREAAAERLAMIPDNQRAEVLQRVTSGFADHGDPAVCAGFIRSQLPETEHASHIASLANQIAVSAGYSEVVDYLDRIDATPAERAASAAEVAATKIRMQASNQALTSEDLDTMREWVDTLAPGTADDITGKALGSVAEYKFNHVAALAVQYHEASGNDDVLSGFLESHAIHTHRDEARVLAEKISDEIRREEILGQLE